MLSGGRSHISKPPFAAQHILFFVPGLNACTHAPNLSLLSSISAWLGQGPGDLSLANRFLLWNGLDISPETSDIGGNAGAEVPSTCLILLQ